jgi:hypothetical protein
MAIGFTSKDFTDNDTTVPIDATNMDKIWAAVKTLSDFFDAYGVNLSGWGGKEKPFGFAETGSGIVTTDCNALTAYPNGSCFYLGAGVANAPGSWGLLVNLGRRYDGLTYQQFILDGGCRVFYRWADTSGGCAWVER